MKTRIFTYIECSCGHRGALIETIGANAFRTGARHAWVRGLTHAGVYDGADSLFAELKPGCPTCSQSLGPADVVGRSELQGIDEVMWLAHEPRLPEPALAADV